MKLDTLTIIFFILCIHTCILCIPSSKQKSSSTKTISQETPTPKTQKPFLNTWYASKRPEPTFNPLQKNSLTPETAAQKILGANPTKAKILQNIESIITKIKTSLNINATKQQITEIVQKMKTKAAASLPETPTTLQVKQFIQNSVDAIKNLNKPQNQKTQTELNIDGTKTEITRDTLGNVTSTTFNTDGTRQVTTQLRNGTTTSKILNNKNEIIKIIEQGPHANIKTTIFNDNGSITIKNRNNGTLTEILTDATGATSSSNILKTNGTLTMQEVYAPMHPASSSIM